jgi:hypothetical protein
MTRVVVVACSAVLSAACASRLPRPAYAAQPTSALVEVDRAPPPARVEVLPARPSSRAAAWIDGEWIWRRGRWAWRPGRWVNPPVGQRFSPWVFVRASDGTLWYAPGVWRDASGAPVDSPPPLATAEVESGEVVDADGVIVTTGPTRRERSGPR